MKPTLAIIKIGGNILDDGRALDAFTELFSSLKTPRILIHGGGKSASELSRKLGIEPNMHEGRRITDAATLDIAVMTYAGLINKNLVAKLQAKTCNAIGISGVDGSLIPATKRISAIEYGFVGDVDYSSINTHLLTLLLNADFIPVIAPITHDKSGQLLNTNADTIASAIASSGSTKTADRRSKWPGIRR